MLISCETRAGLSSLGQIDLRPTKAICVGRNYRAHAAELGNDVPTEPLLFMKPASSLIASGAAILRPSVSERVDHEGELCVVMGKRARELTAENALETVLGYTCANDVTARDRQGKGPWLRAKGLDTFLPIGPRIVTDLDPTELDLEVRVQGEVRQRGNTRDFVFSIVDLLVFVTQEITLEPHDLLLTGTPSGVGNLHPGDTVEVEIEGIGTLSNPVVARS